MLKNKHLNHILYLGLIALMAVSSVPALGTTVASAHTKTNLYKILNEQDAYATGHIDKYGNFTFTRKSFTKRKKNKPFNPDQISSKEAQNYDKSRINAEANHIDATKKLKKLAPKIAFRIKMTKIHPTGKAHKKEEQMLKKLLKEKNALNTSATMAQYMARNKYSKKVWKLQQKDIKNDEKILNNPNASASKKKAARKDMNQNKKTMAQSKAAVKANDEWNRKFAAEERKVAAELNSPKTNTYISESNGQQAAQGLGDGVMPWQVRQNPKWYGQGYIEGLENIGWSSHNAHTAWRLLSHAVKRHPHRSSFWISENAYTGAPQVSSD